MTTFRSFGIGLQEINGYTVNVIRVQKAQHVGESMYPARYFGDITSPDGSVRSMGDAGMTSPSIKRFIGLTLGPNPRHDGGSTSLSDKQLSSLKRAKKALEDAGLPTDEVDTKIADREAEIDALKAERERISEAEKQARKAIKQQIAKLEKAARAMMSAGLDCEDITNKIAELKSQI